MATILNIHPTHPQPRMIEQAVKILARDGVIIYPTDTIYGMGSAITSKKAIEWIVKVKGRDPKKPMSILCADLSQMSEYAAISNFAHRLLKRCLPGPYTFVLPATRKVPKLLLTRQHTIGIRIPDHAVPIALVRALGEPIITTSANKSNQDIITTPDELDARLGAQIDLILASGTLPVHPSTVVSLIDDRVEILRKGLGDIKCFEKGME